MTVPVSSVSGNRRTLHGWSGFAAATTALVGISAALLTFAFKEPGASAAIAISAVIAVVVQVAAFPAVRGLAAKNLMAGWGAGSMVRFLSLGIYALIAGQLFSLPLGPALISLAVFYFLSMVIEPLFLRS